MGAIRKEAGNANWTCSSARVSGATGRRRCSGRAACSMAAISPDNQSRLPASLCHIWDCRSCRIACLVSSGRGFRVIPGPPPCSLSYPRKNPGRCDLVHIPLDVPALDRRHEQRDPNLIRRAGRPPHRLRPDRDRRRGGAGCAGLPPAGLNRTGSASAPFPSLSIRLHLNSLGSPHPDFSVARSRPLPVRRVPQKSVKRGACCGC